MARHSPQPSGPAQSGSTILHSGSSQGSVAQLQDELMSVRFREAEFLAEAKEIRQKLMEVESHNSFLQNQVRRQEEENRSLKKLQEKFQEHVSALEDRLREELVRRDDLEAEVCIY